MASEVHMTGVGATISIGATTINFKRLGLRFNFPATLSAVQDAGQFEGNFVGLPHEAITLNFSAYITANQQIEDLSTKIQGEIGTVIYTEGGVGATPHNFYACTGQVDFSSAEEGNTIDFTITAQGWKQGAITYGFQTV